MAATARIVRGVVFDLDGTLARSPLDFAALRAASGAPPGTDVLAHLDALADADEKMARIAGVEAVERAGFQKMDLMPGIDALIGLLDARGARRGLITRNHCAAIEAFHTLLERSGTRWQPFAPALSRKFRPYKPHPAPHLHICRHWGMSASEVLFVGDSPDDDIVCGSTAGSKTILLDVKGVYASPSADETITWQRELEWEEAPDARTHRDPPPDWHFHPGLQGPMRPTHVVRSLMSLTRLLETHYSLAE